MQDSKVKKKPGPKVGSGKPKPTKEDYKLALIATTEFQVQPILIDEELTVAATSQKIIANNLILMNRAQTQCQVMLPYATAAEASVIMERLARINSELGGGFKNGPTGFNPILFTIVNQIKEVV